MKNSNRLSKYKRMGKRILSVFMIFCMGLSVLPQGTGPLVAEAASFSGASGSGTESSPDQITMTAGGTDDTVLLSGDGIMPIAEEHTHDGITFTAWTSTTSLPDSGSYYLENDVTLSVWLETSANLNLCLNGHTITYDGLPIRVRSGGTLGIYDCQGNGTVVSDESYCIRIYSGGTANIYGGIFNSTDYPAIYVEGTVTIENASVSSGSNAVSIQSYGTANIYGGTFVSTSNPAISAVANASLEITDGTFIRNNGGNVIQNQGTLEMLGGTVTGDSSSSNGAVGIVNSGTSAKATIKNVTVTTEGTDIADIGDIDDIDNDPNDPNNPYKGPDKGLRNDNGGTMTVENCNITSSNWAVWNTGGSTIQISGGTFNGQYGIYNKNGKFELSGSPTFAGSTADIYLSNNQKITVTGTLGNAAPYSVLTATDPAVGRPVEITDSSTTSYNVAAKFTAADSRYAVRKNSDAHDQLELVLAYTITYNAGSYGSGSVSSGTKAEGVDFTLSSQTFTRTGYTQTGWSTTDGGAKEYDLGGTYSTDDSITLYPYWTANEYGITYMDQGGVAFSGTHESGYPTKHTYGTATTLKSATKAGYSFDGWYTDSSCTNKVTSLGATDYTSNITLYARWVANEYDIIYMDQGGAVFSGTHESGYPTKHTYGRTTTLKSATKTGYSFGGWYTDSSCTNKVTSLGATGYTSNITLYAKWIVRGNVEVKAESGENAPDVNLPMEKEELENIVLTEQEHKELDEGKDIKISLIVEDASNTVSEEDKQEIEKGASYYTIGQYLDISLIKTITINGGEGEASLIHNISNPIRIVITIPEELKGEKDRDYAIVRLHEGVTTLLEDLENPDNPDTITIETDRFSTYAMVYTELTDEDRVKAAKEKLPELLDDVIVTNDTTRESLEKQLQEAMDEAGFGDVKVTVGEDFDKDLATADKEGRVTATVTVSKGEASADNTNFDKNIAKLEPTPTPSTPSGSTPSAEPSTTPSTEPSTTPPTVTLPPSEQEKNSIAMMAGFKVSQTGEKISIKWGKVKGADGYQVYVTYCGKDFTGKPIKTVKSASLTKVKVTKIDGKKLNLKKNYKVYITAYKIVNGKKVIVGKTLVGHIVGKKNHAYTNVKQVKVSKSKYTLQAGKTAKIEAKTVPVDKTKKQFSDAHAKALRYKSTDTRVAVVSKKGKISAKGKGSCIIYVYARNGYAKKIKVTVK